MTHIRASPRSILSSPLLWPLPSHPRRDVKMSHADTIDLRSLEYERSNGKKTPAHHTTRLVSNSSANFSTPTPSAVANDTSHEEDTESRRPFVVASVEAQQKWNEPRINMYRTFSTFWCMLVMGMNDAALGVSNSHIKEPGGAVKDFDGLIKSDRL